MKIFNPALSDTPSIKIATHSYTNTFYLNRIKNANKIRTKKERHLVAFYISTKRYSVLINLSKKLLSTNRLSEGKLAVHQEPTEKYKPLRKKLLEIVNENDEDSEKRFNTLLDKGDILQNISILQILSKKTKKSLTSLDFDNFDRTSLNSVGYEILDETSKESLLFDISTYGKSKQSLEYDIKGEGQEVRDTSCFDFGYDLESIGTFDGFFKSNLPKCHHSLKCDKPREKEREPPKKESSSHKEFYHVLLKPVFK
ncbi:hypothetical protein C922_05797 [Plasmodium inui San Antonio 1]|uniref:Uncharacterized protein n=1 Tax=Plasmodium inui San Antonio 1 TaxID=1237626 RepID=W6ZSE0_9APIC|nr:hypothetical protein C922_05797 [Plasmodium inui San Antonio 1]EUD63822.1 hypothetical protein C922_05797 [Plasmodium inui San Antonio 1]